MSVLKTLSVVNVIWIIAAGVLIFFLLFLFAKRQILRFTMSKRGPYVSIGTDAPKSMKGEIQRLLNRVPEIKYEPVLLSGTMEQTAESTPNHYLYRMKAMDSFRRFDEVLRKEVPAACRNPTQTVRNYLYTIYPVYLASAPPETVEQFIEMYEHARHKPEPFEKPHFVRFSQLLEELISSLEDGIKLKKEANKRLQVEQLQDLPLVDTEVTVKFNNKGIGKTKTSIPYNHMTSTEKYNRGQTRYRTRASSSEQAGLLESAPSSQRSSMEALVINHESSEENIHLVQVDMNTMPDIQ